MADDRELIIVAGANGTGKTTFAKQYVAEHGLPYLGADAIAEQLAPGNPASARVQAGRQFVQRLDSHVQNRESIVVESTLSGLMLAKSILRAKQSGLSVSIFYLHLDSPETCIQRVIQRVRRGGHSVPEEDIRRRFGRSIHNFWNVCREMADNWVVVYNGPDRSCDIAIGTRHESRIRNAELFRLFRRLVDSSLH